MAIGMAAALGLLFAVDSLVLSARTKTAAVNGGCV
jgi:hypothetical protein